MHASEEPNPFWPQISSQIAGWVLLLFYKYKLLFYAWDLFIILYKLVSCVSCKSNWVYTAIVNTQDKQSSSSATEVDKMPNKVPPMWFKKAGLKNEPPDTDSQ